MGEARRQLLQQVPDQVLARGQIDEQIVRARQERIVHVHHGDLVRLIEVVVDAVEVHRRVVRNEADLGAGVARQLLQVLGQRGAQHVQVAGLHGDLGDVQQEQVDGRLRRAKLCGTITVGVNGLVLLLFALVAHHVLGRSDELNRAVLHLGPTHHVAVRFAGRIVLELVGNCLGN